MRLVALMIAALLAGGSATQSQQASPTATAGAADDGTHCDAACGHYAACKGIADASFDKQCADQCRDAQRQGQVSAQETYLFTQLTCETAIATVESRIGPQD